MAAMLPLSHFSPVQAKNQKRDPLPNYHFFQSEDQQRIHQNSPFMPTQLLGVLAQAWESVHIRHGQSHLSASEASFYCRTFGPPCSVLHLSWRETSQQEVRQELFGGSWDWTHQRFNLGLFTCKTYALLLTYSPNPWNLALCKIGSS